jgi:tRNA(fMet)-specific endonuclease VapC
LYVLDTNTLIYFFKGLGNVAERLLSLPPTQIAIPAIVRFELEVGIAKSKAPQKRSQQLNDMFGVIQILPFGSEEAKMAALIRAELEKKGTPIGPYDILIAGTTLAHRATLITHNIGEFARVEKLQLEDWY